jgi:hypothetical protein
MMSHIVQIQTQVKDAAAVQAACERLKLPPPLQRSVRLFSGEATGLAVELPGWRYPVVCDTATGELKYDNFEGRWGDAALLQRFLQAYAVEKVKLEARKADQSATEQQLADGSIRVQVVTSA